MRPMNLPPIWLDSLAASLKKPGKYLGHGLAREQLAALRVPEAVEEGPTTSWENFWIDLGGEG